MICLKNRTFAVSQTTVRIPSSVFARCDLLEKSYFCSITNNATNNSSPSLRVVICLKNRTFAVSQTTRHYRGRDQFSCDLLEKSYFCSITNNRTSRYPPSFCVVICLKNRTFAVSQTTIPRTDAGGETL